MKSILSQLHILSEQANEKSDPVTILVIKNWDGTPRWICNANATNPLFLNFYLVSSLRSQLFTWMVRIIFFMRLQKLVFTTEEVKLIPKNLQNNFILDFTGVNWALFTGTVGPNNKVLVVEEVAGKKYFYKVAGTRNALELIDNEASVIAKLNRLNLKSIQLPEAKKVNVFTLKLEDISIFGNRNTSFTPLHSKALKELAQKTHQSAFLNTLPIYKETIHKLETLEKSTDCRIPNGLVRKLRLMTRGLKFMEVDTTMSHGDFTPWNMYVSNNKLAVYDWELAHTDMPIGFDAFHFLIQKGILLDRVSWESIKTMIDTQITSAFLGAEHIPPKRSVAAYLKLYLLINTVNNLALYAQQAEWHTQIFWLINTWNQAISQSLEDYKEHRSLVIMDVFDYLQPKDYATIKFPDILPDHLSEYSDIDVCIRKNEVHTLVDYLKVHPLVQFVHTDVVTHMNAIQLFCKDGSLLSMDLIWQLSRKSLVMMNAEQVIERASQNYFGVKRMTDLDAARYVALFYGLNHAAVPDKYMLYELSLANGKGELDHVLYESYSKPLMHYEVMVSYLKTLKENGFAQRLVLGLKYYTDVVKHLIKTKGITITFSGVDGAGKSTVIESIRYEIEKKLRKKVVVLRHRPSILPILSAWVKGKAQAELDAANTLPRQGKNKSFLNSMFRFSYYYLDYVLGQFYINVKYLRRGYVVLYDRYYFDFINDSLRSNIVLPKALLKAGYRLLFKPELNFFLFADPEVILSRKKELTKETITALTHDYLELFKELDTGSIQKHFSIENIELNNTIHLIMNKTMNEVA
tara:strand:+ start:7527 stop:9935 length:2409 start_codon:yes stop_codon:yes gene_type:complete